MSLHDQLRRLLPQMAYAAQRVIDAWNQDTSGYDEDLGEGGACDAVADALRSVIESGIADVDVLDGGHDGDDHAWIIVCSYDEAFGVDIPPNVYETGGGYRWRKIEDARISPADIVIWRLRRSDIE